MDDILAPRLASAPRAKAQGLPARFYSVLSRDTRVYVDVIAELQHDTSRHQRLIRLSVRHVSAYDPDCGAAIRVSGTLARRISPSSRSFRLLAQSGICSGAFRRSPDSHRLKAPLRLSIFSVVNY